MRGRLAAVPAVSLEEGLAKDGAAIFTKNCSGCHYADKTDTRIGPGLKGLFKRDTLPVSGRAVSETNIRKQLKTPFRAMPSFAGLQEEEVKALLAFLQTL
jgi:cytochrome c2